MTVVFNVNKKAQDSLGNKVLEKADVLSAIKNRFGENIEAADAVYPFIAYNEAADMNFYEMIQRKDEDWQSKYGDRLMKDLLIKSLKGFSHPFVEAIHTAYDRHYPIVLSPDSVWMCIAQGFANHVNMNSNLLKEKFVNHEIKKLIVLRRDDFIKGSSDNNWQDCFPEFSDKIRESIGKKVDLVINKFSTTGLIEKSVSEIVLMDAVKAYFKFGVETMCGIPKVTLTGTIEDWENIFLRAENLSEFDLEWWCNGLLPVLEKLIATSKGNPDIDFWDEIYKKNNGSGGPYISGWINTLFPYIQVGKQMIKNSYIEKYKIGKPGGGGPKPTHFPNGLSRVPFKWQYFNTVHDMEFLGGMVGFYQDPNTLSISPNIGWAIRDMGISRSGEIDPNEDW